MRIYILSRNARGHTASRLKQAARDRGHEVRVLDTLRFSIFIEKQKPALLYDGKPLRKCDAVIPRIGASVTFFGTAVVRHYEQMGVFTLNTSQSINLSRDKLRAAQIFSRHDLGMPATAFVRDRGSVLPAIEMAGGAPVIIKLLEGTQGVGVILAETADIAQAIVETLQAGQQNVLIQKFVSESKGRDIRCIVVGGRVVAAMRRVAAGGGYRSNLHRGGSVEPVDLDPEYESAAIRAAQVLGLRAAGVDLLETGAGPQILEVNSSPGLKGIEQITGVDIAAAIISHVEEQAAFPDVDIRQRLTLKSGYAVAELTVASNSPLANTTVSAAQLKDRDILVLNILRGSIAIPNPRGSQNILPGDILVCYGSTQSLKELIPAGRKSRAGKAAPPAGAN